MKNTKFSIKTIEEGRMEGSEMKRIHGAGCNPFFSCPSGFDVEVCALHLSCSGPYEYCDDIAHESCGGNFGIVVECPTF